MRIGTWNLEGRWDERHRALLLSLQCDIVLLTEVVDRVAMPGHQLHASVGYMAPGRRWAAVASTMPMKPRPDPHGASAMAEVDGLRVCSSILPWRTCGRDAPWIGATTAEKTSAAMRDIESTRPDVWGGDWNHALTGREVAGSLAGRRELLKAVDRLGLQVPTVELLHQENCISTIDHVAVPKTWRVDVADRVSGAWEGRRLSDHDAYVVTVERS